VWLLGVRVLSFWGIVPHHIFWKSHDLVVFLVCLTFLSGLYMGGMDVSYILHSRSTMVWSLQTLTTGMGRGGIEVTSTG
jgi:hypothetical protein